MALFILIVVVVVPYHLSHFSFGIITHIMKIDNKNNNIRISLILFKLWLHFIL